jgi:hypothetical protein
METISVRQEVVELEEFDERKEEERKYHWYDD